MQDSSVTITITAIDGATKVFQGVGDTAVRQANRAAAAWQKANGVQNVAIESTGNLGKATGKAASQQDRLTTSTRRSYLAQTALTTVLSASINKAFLEMVDVTGQAINRVDLLAQFPASMAALGLSATDASVSLGKLSQYIGNIGGNLQEATTSVARFAEVTGNVKAATAEFVGVNNALIAGGAGAEVQKNALEQLTQAYSRGKPQLIEWRSLLVAMPAQLNTVAKAMGFANAQVLGESLTTGKTSMQAFMTELTKLSTTGGPILTQAEARMNGIQFAFNRFKNTMVAGMTEIIQTIGRQNIIDFFNFLTGAVRQLAIWAVKAVSILFSLFNIISRVFGGPQLKLAKDNTAGIADNLSTGADHAGDLADGLDDASKAAKKTVGQLAAFDKMNVLTEPADASGGKDKGAGDSPGSGLSAADTAALEDIFNKMKFDIGEISQASKILAGILAGIAGIKLAEGLLNQFNGLVKTIKDTGKNIDDIKKKLFGFTDDGGKKVDGLAQKMGKLGKSLGSAGADAGSAIASGIAGALGALSQQLWKYIVVPIASAVTGALALIGAIVIEFLISIGVLAAAVTVPFWALVAIGALVVAAIIALVWLIWKNWDTIMTFITGLATTVWNFLVGVFNGIVEGIKTAWNFLYDIFAAPIKWFIQFWEAIFTLAVAIVAIMVELLFKLIVFLVVGIFNILSAIAGWIWDNVIMPVVNFFTWLWKTIIDAVTAAWNWIFEKVLRPIGNWINVNVVQPVFNFFKGLWDGIVGLVTGFWNTVMNILRPFGSWIKGNIIDPVLGFFNWLWDRIKEGLSWMINGLGELFGNITGFVKAPINGIIDLINNVLKQLNKVKVPDWVPGLGGKGVNFPLIPKLARGGIVQQSTIANIGESGAEAIVPLENNLEWIDKLAAKINNHSNGQPIQLTVQIGEDKVATKIIELINEKTQMSGRNQVFV